MSVLSRRIISGVVYGSISLSAVYLGGVPFLGAVLVMSLLAGREYQRMMARGGYRPLYVLQFGLTAFLVLGVALLAPNQVLGGLVLILIGSLSWQLTRATRGERPFVDWSLTLVGALYLGLLPAYFVKLRDLTGGLSWMILALAAAWSCDSFAYVFGRLWGRRSFFSGVSPRKTWEGALAGWFGATVVILILGQLLGVSAPWSLGFGLVVPLAAICGDLVESMIKRQMGVKDSGGLVPGHGGMLDRVDSLLFAIVVAYYYVTLVRGG
ncbi:MAG TPA: phosphatidate cytidylyltransferase [Anaerolineae bacterium]|nr:phosphatidate cytidylyltransferase [Anaerolineae bacterium]